MLPKANRLESSRIFDIIKNDKRINGKYLSIKYLPSDDLKCAIVVAKKHVSCNAERNLVKRWIRYAFMDLMKENLAGEYTLVITLLNCKDCDFASISRDLRGVLSRLPAIQKK